MSEYMTGMTLAAVTEAVGGTYHGPEALKESLLSDIVIDSRKVSKDCLFVAIKGARVDGNTFIPSAYEDGAVCCMSTEQPADPGKAFIRVDSCEQALKDMAEYYRSLLKVKVVGITGSVGKTTTKEMIASVVSQKYDTLKTLGNFNNEIGLPLTIFRLRDHHEVAILEMGISEFGEMSRLAKVAEPDICVITNIGQCHLENLGSRDGILQAKTEMFDYCKTGAKVFLNGNDDKLATLTEDKRISAPVYFGLSEESVPLSVTAGRTESLGLAGNRVDIVTPKGTVNVTVPAPGNHMITNALAAAAVGIGLDVSLEQIKAGIESYEPVGGHGHIIRTEKLTILDDCYNANPVSMKAGLDVLAEVTGRRVAFLGDMYELGADEKEMHRDIGSYAARKGIDTVIAIGGLAAEYQKGFEEAKEKDGTLPGKLYYFKTLEEALPKVMEYIQVQDAVLVKASHAMHFDEIVRVLQE